MAARRVVAMVAIALVAASCGGSSGSADAPLGNVGVSAVGATSTTVSATSGTVAAIDDGAYQTWSDVRSDLAPGPDSGSANPCNSGSDRCFELLLAEMESRADILIEACDHDAIFALIYVHETRAVRSRALSGSIEDAASLTNLTAWFAAKYIDAYDAWHRGLAGVPASWDLAFVAARDRTHRGIGNALLGLNAHIGYDLPTAVAEVIVPGPGAEPPPDFVAIDETIAETIDPALAELAARLDPQIALADDGIAKSVFNEGVSQMRAFAFEDAIRIVEGDAMTQAGIDGRVTGLGATLGATARYALPAEGDIRDQFCLDQR